MKLKHIIPMAMLAGSSVGNLSAQEAHNTIATTESHETPHFVEEKKHRNFNVAVGESLVLNREENKVIIGGEVFRKIHLKGLGDREIGLELGAVFNKHGVEEGVLVPKEEIFKLFNTNVFLKQEIAFGKEGIEIKPGINLHRGFELDGREYHLMIGALMDPKRHMEEHAHRFSGEIGVAVSLLK